MRAVAALCVAVLAACGDGLPGRGDASTDTPPATPVRLKVSGNAGGLRVFFQAADGTLQSATYTNGLGEANAFVPPGGYVTVRAANGELFTWSGVEPGDQLVLGTTPDFADTVQLRISVPVDAQATSYFLNSSCGGEQDITGAQVAPVPVALSGCGGVADLLLVTKAPAPPDFFEAPLHIAARFAVPLATPIVTLALPGPLLDLQPSHVAFLHAPPSVEELDMRQVVVGDLGQLFDSGAKRAVHVDLAADPTAQVGVPLLPGTRLVTYAGEAPDAPHSQLTSITWTPVTAQTTVELSGGPPPLLSINWDPIHLIVSWSQQAIPTAPELAAIDLVFMDGKHWHVAGTPLPPLPQLALPPLPDPDLLPQSAAVATAKLSLVESTTELGALRASIFNSLASKQWPVVGESGRIVYQTLSR